MKFLLAIAILTLSAASSFGQISKHSIDEWVKRLSDPNDKKNVNYKLLFESIVLVKDTTTLNNLVKQLEAKGDIDNQYFKTRLDVVKAVTLNRKDFLQSNFASKQ